MNITPITACNYQLVKSTPIRWYAEQIIMYLELFPVDKPSLWNVQNQGEWVATVNEVILFNFRYHLRVQTLHSRRVSIPAARFPTCFTELNHRGRMTHICVGNLIKCGSDNGLSPSRRQTIIWTNAEIFYWVLKTNFSEILIEIRTFSFKKMHLKNFVCKMTAISSRPHCVKEIKSFIGPWQQYIQYGATWKEVEQSNDVAVELTTHTTCLDIAGDHVWV